MERPERMNHQEHGYGLLRMLFSCGLLLMGMPVLSSIGANWGVPFILLALIVCPLLMRLMSNPASGRWRPHWKEAGREQNM